MKVIPSAPCQLTKDERRCQIHLRHDDVIWKFSITQNVPDTLNEDDLKDAKSVNTSAMNRDGGRER